MRKYRSAALVRLQLLMLLLLSLSVTGCAIAKRFNPVSEAFLNGADVNKRIDSLPFDHAAVHNKVSESAHNRVLILPVRTDTLQLSEWQNSQSLIITSEADYVAEARRLADYFREFLVKSIEQLPNRGWELTDKRGPGVAVVEIAITELEFSRPLAQAFAIASPMPGAGAAVSSMTDPHVAFAMRITDAQNGMLIATIADRKFAPTRIVDLNKLSATSSVQEIVELWSESLAQTFLSGRYEVIEEQDTSLFTLW